jgi:hypothetical protein
MSVALRSVPRARCQERKRAVKALRLLHARSGCDVLIDEGAHVVFEVAGYGELGAGVQLRIAAAIEPVPELGAFSQLGHGE